MSGPRLPRSDVAPLEGRKSTGSISLEPRIQLAAAAFTAAEARKRRRMWRMHLQASVTRINRLALDVAVAPGIGPAEMAAMLEPPRDWPWAMLDTGPVPSSWGIDDAIGHAPASRMERHYGGGCVWDIGSGVDGKAPCSPEELRFRADGSCIEVEGRLGRGYLATSGETASLEIPDDLPVPVAAPLAGRTIDDLLGHQLFAGREYVIRSAREPSWGSLRFCSATARCRCRC